MTNQPLTAEQANAVFDILVSHLGVPQRQRSQFVCEQTSRPLARVPLGGVVHQAEFVREFANVRQDVLVGPVVPERWYVGTPEPLAGDRARAVESANRALLMLQSSWS